MEKIENARFSKNDIIGKGRYCSVFKGQLRRKKDKSFKDVAVKQYNSKDTKINFELLCEARGHPNILYFHLAKAHQGFKYLVEDLCAGTLKDAMNGNCVCPSNPLHQITSGLNHLHLLKIMHSDLKPSNILVSFPQYNSGATIKLADFGLRHLYSRKRGKNKRFQSAFSKGWRAPEQNLTCASDIYSLGRVYCFTLYKGLFPSKSKLIEFQAFLVKEKEREPTAFSWSIDDMVELIESMLNCKVEERPTAAQVLEHPVLAVGPPQPELKTTAESSGKEARMQEEESDNDDVIVLPPPPQKVVDVVDVCSSSEDEAEDDDSAASSSFSEDSSSSSSDADSSDSDTSEPVQSGSESPPPRRAGFKRTQILDSSDEEESDEPQEETRKLRKLTKSADPLSKAGVWRYGHIPRTQDEKDLLQLCEQEGLNEEDMARLTRLLLNNDVSVNCCRKLTCDTPLMLLCSNKTDSLVSLLKILLQRQDLDLSLRNRLGQSSLSLLCRNSQNVNMLHCVRLLVDRGTDVTSKDCYGRCCLNLLCRFYKGRDIIEITRLLIHPDMEAEDLQTCVDILRGRKLRHDLLEDLIQAMDRNDD